MKKYFITMTVEAEIEVDESLFDVVDEDWKKCFYDFEEDIDVAEHIGYNMVANRYSLSDLDGFADQPDSKARFVDWPSYQIDSIIEIS
jgi:hypothetical protein